VANTFHEIGVALQIGTYSDAIEVGPNSRWLFSSGTPGPRTDGVLPQDIVGQTEETWKNIDSILASAGMTYKDLVQVTTYLIREEDGQVYAKTRAKILDGHKPAIILVIVSGLVRDDMFLEVQFVAAKTA
jgi:enamine deaminase RidA (YjgF/YER057c/UK114 family)